MEFELSPHAANRYAKRVYPVVKHTFVGEFFAKCDRISRLKYNEVTGQWPQNNKTYLTRSYNGSIFIIGCKKLHEFKWMVCTILRYDRRNGEWRSNN